MSATNDRTSTLPESPDNETDSGWTHVNPPVATADLSGSSAGPPGAGPVPNRRQRLQAQVKKVGVTLQKFNLAKLIDDMEHDQEFADRLEVVNTDLQEEAQRKDLVREAYAKCHAEIQSHLTDFLDQQPDATYEDWIQDLHPDNVSDGTLLSDLKQIDFRFYVEDSDHRVMWNEAVPDDRKKIAPRTFQVPADNSSGPYVDLLE